MRKPQSVSEHVKIIIANAFLSTANTFIQDAGRPRMSPVVYFDKLNTNIVSKKFVTKSVKIGSDNSFRGVFKLLLT